MFHDLQLESDLSTEMNRIKQITDPEQRAAEALRVLEQAGHAQQTLASHVRDIENQRTGYERRTDDLLDCIKGGQSLLRLVVEHTPPYNQSKQKRPIAAIVATFFIGLVLGMMLLSSMAEPIVAIRNFIGLTQPTKIVKINVASPPVVVQSTKEVQVAQPYVIRIMESQALGRYPLPIYEGETLIVANKQGCAISVTSDQYQDAISATVRKTSQASGSLLQITGKQGTVATIHCTGNTAIGYTFDPKSLSVMAFYAMVAYNDDLQQLHKGGHLLTVQPFDPESYPLTI